MMMMNFPPNVAFRVRTYDLAPSNSFAIMLHGAPSFTNTLASDMVLRLRTHRRLSATI